MKCNKCGNINEESANYCTNCGNHLEKINNNTNINIVNNIGSNNNTVNYKVLLIVVLVCIAGFLGVILAVNNKSSNTSKNEPISQVVSNNKTGTRTVMVYMDGSNLEYDNGIATADLKSISKDFDLTSVNLYVYTGGTKNWKWSMISNNENAIFKYTENGYEKVMTYPKKSMGSPDTLTEFLNYAKNDSKTDLYDLIIYNHGGAIDGAVYDDFTKDNLSLNDFDTALKNSVFKDKRLELILFRTCLNGTIEVASTLSNYANYMVASEEVTWGSPLTPVLEFLNNINKDTSSIDFGKEYIKKYKSQTKYMDYEDEYLHHYAVVDLSKVNKLVKEFNNYTEGLDINNNYSELVKVRDNLIQYGYTFANVADYDTVDLKTFINRTSKLSKVDSKDVLAAFDDAIVYSWSNTEDTEGLSVYFPDRAGNRMTDYYLNIYSKLSGFEAYYSFLEKYVAKRRSSTSTTLSKSTIEESQTKTSGKEFSITLTDKQAESYLNGIYLVFKYNEEDDSYQAVYSSDNIVKKGNVLSSNMSGHLLRIAAQDAKTGEQFDEGLLIIERGMGDKKTRMTTAVVYDKEAKENSLGMHAVWINFSTNDKGEPYISKITEINSNDDSKGAAGVIRKPEEFKTIEYYNRHYNILDKNGKYTQNWKAKDLSTGFGYNSDDKIKYYYDNLKDGKYYGVFVLRDIYNNEIASDLIEIK